MEKLESASMIFIVLLIHLKASDLACNQNNR